MIIFSQALNWLSRHVFSRVQTMVVILLIVLLASVWMLRSENKRLDEKLTASQETVARIETAFKSYQESQEQIAVGLQELIRTQNEIAADQRAFREFIDDTATDENRRYDPFWESVFGGMPDGADPSGD